MGRLEGKVAIVTGGSRGMGRGYSERFAAEGARVALVYLSNEEAAQDVLKSIEKAGGTAKAYRCDVTNPAEIETMVSSVVSDFGGVDILVNNAGIYLFTPADGEGTTEEVWDRQINTNLKSTFFCCQAVVPHMKKRGGGKIINIGSIFGVDGYPGSSAYCATKAANDMVTKCLCLELRPYNIQVNTLAPGCIETDLNAEYRTDESGDFLRTLQERFGEGDPWLKPQETAGTAVFLASSDADSVTGATVMVDRGYSAY